MAVAHEQFGGLLVADVRVDPMPGGGGEDEVVGLGGRLAGLEAVVDDLHIAECGEVAASFSGQRCPELDAADTEPASREGKRCLSGGAADLEEPRLRPQLGDVEQPVDRFDGSASREVMRRTTSHEPAEFPRPEVKNPWREGAVG
jgi:hypothetical protein